MQAWLRIHRHVVRSAATSGHVVDKLWLVEPQTVKVDNVHISTQTRQQPTAVRQSKKVRGFARLPRC
jgi:hypothetical protein